MMRAFVLALSLALAGCAALKGAESPTLLRVSPSFDAAAPLSRSVSIAPIAARGIAGDRRYGYVDRSAPNEPRQAATLFWEEPPPQIIEDALVARLRGAGPPLRLVAVLDRFEEVTGGGAPAVASIALDVSTPGGGAAMSARFCASSPIAGASPTARAQAFERALADLVGRIGQAIERPAGSAGTGC